MAAPLQVSGLAGGVALAATVPDAPALKVQQVYGKAEAKRNGVWTPLTAAQGVGSAVRTGAGQAELRAGTGLLLLDTSSSITIYRGEFQTAQGQFYAEGPLKMYVGPYHLNAEKGAAFRIDAIGAQPRLAVLEKSLRIAFDSGVVTVSSGQQLNLKTGKVTSFRELDPWYKARFVGRGTAQIEALRGRVRVGKRTLHPATVGHQLGAGEVIATGRNSWAELGFSAGGYLRLQAKSALKVLRIDRTTQGQQVWLQLTKGSAWNVLEPNRGGYRITTPVVNTAVRGTVYRVDADGLVKVFEGSVATDETSVEEGQQLDAVTHAPRPLVLGELDRMNMALDDLRAQPIRLKVRGWASLGDLAGQQVQAGQQRADIGLQDLEVQAAALSQVQLYLRPVSATAAKAKARVWALQPTVPAWVAPSGQLYRPGTRTYRLPAAAQVILRQLPAGTYQLTVVAARYGRQEKLERTLSITAHEGRQKHDSER